MLLLRSLIIVLLLVSPCLADKESRKYELEMRKQRLLELRLWRGRQKLYRMEMGKYYPVYIYVPYIPRTNVTTTYYWYRY